MFDDWRDFLYVTGQVALVACGQALPAGQPALQVPADILQWLDQRSGVVYVAR